MNPKRQASIPLTTGLAGSVVSAAGSLAQPFINSYFANEEFERNKEMWLMQQEYNSPKNQMARYKAAGLNPHLMFGSITPGNAQSAPQYNAPDASIPFTNIGSQIANVGMNYVSTLQNARLTDANVTKAEADAELARKNAGLAEQKTETEKYNTSIAASNAISAECKANVDSAVQSILISIEFQKLQNLTAQEKETYSRIAAQEVLNKLNEEKITTEQFMRGLEKAKLSLQKKIYDNNRYFQWADYTLRKNNTKWEHDFKQNEFYQHQIEYIVEVEKWCKEMGLEFEKERINTAVKRLDAKRKRNKSVDPLRIFNLFGGD